MIRRRGAHDDDIDLARRDAGSRHGLLRRFRTEGAERLARLGDVALANAGTLDDPLVVGVDPHGREVMVRDDPVRYGVAGAGDIRERTLHVADPVASACGIDSASR
jgi:hypothetical protein